jgi:hypothetical protein
MSQTVHDLKTWPEYFEQLDNGEKTFEIRRNDRGFKQGDVLRLREYDPARCNADGCKRGNCPGYTGRSIVYRVGFVYDGGVGGLEDGYVVMALRPLLSRMPS